MASLLFYPPPLAAQGTGHKLVAAPAEPPRKKNPNQQPPENVTGTKTLKVKVNFVAVPVVVRDSAGRAVGNLHREDFQIFDNRKPEEITQFMMVRAEQSATASTASLSVKGSKFVVPDRFTATLFDDVHSTFQNLPQLQAASAHLVANALARSERLGIFTTSGKLTVDFTDDRAKLQDAIRKLKPNPLPGSLATSCPRLSHYDANQIVNRNDLAAREAAISEVMGQCGVKDRKVAVVIVMAAAQRVLLAGDEETSLALRALSALLDRLSALRGQRAIVLASPSFLISDHEHREYEVVDRAVRSHVVISTLDTRGVYTDENDIFDSNVLSEFADATGGIFFHNNNDLNEGLRRAVSAPEYVYELGFSPNDLKEDGKFHHLKVKLVGNKGLVVSAREGYFAPTHALDLKQAERNELNDVLFSQNQIHDLPVQMHMQLAQENKAMATLKVMALVDFRDMPHRQVDDQDANELRLVAAVFDRNGKYMGAIERKVAVRWSDGKEGTQAATTFSFLLDSGGYLVRLVVRDSESQQFCAQDALVEIP